MLRTVAIAVWLTAGLVWAQEKKAADAKAAKPEAMPAPPPEVKQTTDAFVGTWAGESTADVGDGKPEKFKATMECKKVALGAGASCSMAAKASIGPMEQTCLAAYDPEGKAVHLMCVTSMGEVHDHKGSWAADGKAITFEPFKGGMAGKPITEDVSFTWSDPKTLSHTSVVTMADGKKMTFTWSGKRK